MLYLNKKHTDVRFQVEGAREIIKKQKLGGIL